MKTIHEIILCKTNGLGDSQSKHLDAIFSGWVMAPEFVMDAFLLEFCEIWLRKLPSLSDKRRGHVNTVVLQLLGFLSF